MHSRDNLIKLGHLLLMLVMLVMQVVVDSEGDLAAQVRSCGTAACTTSRQLAS
jgi:hypothetical protein